MQRSAFAIIVTIAIPCVHAGEAANADLERKFTQTVRPFLTSYCIGCHSGSTPAAQFDLAPYSTMAAVVRDYPHWNLVLEKLTAKADAAEGRSSSRPTKPARQ